MIKLYRIIDIVNKALFNLDYEINIVRKLPQLDRESIIVYQMGKVASTSICSSLNSYIYLDATINQEHRLTSNNWNTYNYEKKRISMRLRNRIEFLKKKGKRFKVITLTRDPVGYCFSAYFQDFFKIFPDISEKYSDDSKIVEEVKRYFFQQLDYYLNKEKNGININKIVQYHFNNPLTFFDLELKHVFDIDVYKNRYPIDKKYFIYKDKYADVLLIKYEYLNECIKDAMKEFLNIEKFLLQKKNVGSQKKQRHIYKEFLDSINVPKEFLDKQYSSKYMKHFYSKSEIDSFYKKWTANS